MTQFRQGDVQYISSQSFFLVKKKTNQELALLYFEELPI